MAIAGVRTIKLVIDSSDVKKETAKTNTHLDSIRKSSIKTSAALSRLMTIGGAMFAISAVKSLAQFNLELALSAEKVDLLSKKMVTLTSDLSALDKVLASADRVGVSFDELGSVVGRFSVATKNAFAVDDMLKWTEGIIKSGRLVGSTQKEISSGLIQLSQSLSAGALMGDEYRSVMENLPLLAIELRNSFDDSTMSLKEMSSQGMLTSEVVVGAMDRLAAKLEGLPGLTDTVSSQVARMGNAWDLMLASMMDSTDNWVTDTIAGVTYVMKTVTDIMGLFGSQDLSNAYVGLNIASDEMERLSSEIAKYEALLSSAQAGTESYAKNILVGLNISLTKVSKTYDKHNKVIVAHNKLKKEEADLNDLSEFKKREAALTKEFDLNQKLLNLTKESAMEADKSLAIHAKWEAYRERINDSLLDEITSSKALAEAQEALARSYVLEDKAIADLLPKKKAKKDLEDDTCGRIKVKLTCETKLLHEYDKVAEATYNKEQALLDLDYTMNKVGLTSGVYGKALNEINEEYDKSIDKIMGLEDQTKDSTKAMGSDWDKLNTNIQSEFIDRFADMLTGAENSFEGFAESILKMWINTTMNMAFDPQMSAGGMDTSGSSGGMVSSIMGGDSSGSSSLSSLNNLKSVFTSGSEFFTTAASMAMAAVPYVGAAIAIASALGMFDSNSDVTPDFNTQASRSGSFNASNIGLGITQLGGEENGSYDPVGYTVGRFATMNFATQHDAFSSEEDAMAFSQAMADRYMTLETAVFNAFGEDVSEQIYNAMDNFSSYEFKEEDFSGLDDANQALHFIFAEIFQGVGRIADEEISQFEQIYKEGLSKYGHSLDAAISRLAVAKGAYEGEDNTRSLENIIGLVDAFALSTNDLEEQLLEMAAVAQLLNFEQVNDEFKTFMADVDSIITTGMAGTTEAIIYDFNYANSRLSELQDDLKLAEAEDPGLDMGGFIVESSAVKDLRNEITALESEINNAVDVTYVLNTELEYSAQELLGLATNLINVNGILPNVNQEVFTLTLASAELVDTLIAGAGGIELFTSKMDYYYNNFYSEQERTQDLYDSTTQAIADFNDTYETSILSESELRTSMEAMDLTTEAGIEMYNALLNLAPVMVTNTDAFERLAELTAAEEVVEEVVELEEVLEEVIEPIEDVTNSLKELFYELTHESEVNNTIRAINELMSEFGFVGNHASFTTDQLADLVKVLDGFDSATIDSMDSLNDLGSAMLRLENIINSTQDSIDSILGDQRLADLDAQIAAQQELTDSSNAAYDSDMARYEAAINANKTIYEFLDSLKISDLNNQSPLQQMEASAQLFNDSVSSGDADAATKYAQEYLQFAQSFYASTGAYDEIFSNVTGSLEDMLSDPSIPNAPGGSYGGGLSAAEIERAELESQLRAADLRAQNEELIGMFNTLALAKDESLFDIAEQNGVDLEKLGLDLIGTLDTWNAATVRSIEQLAKDNGLTSATLAETLAIDYDEMIIRMSDQGTLLTSIQNYDAQLVGESKLTNDRIWDLAQDQLWSTETIATKMGITNDEVVGWLKAQGVSLDWIELYNLNANNLNAANNRMLVSIDQSLIEIDKKTYDYATELGYGGQYTDNQILQRIMDLMGGTNRPYLEYMIDYSQVSNQWLERIAANTYTLARGYLGVNEAGGWAITGNVGVSVDGANPAYVGANSYAEGTNYVPDDQYAFLHKGEAVIPVAYNQNTKSSDSQNNLAKMNEALLNELVNVKLELQSIKSINAFGFKKTLEFDKKMVDQAEEANERERLNE